jgi:hypothetical protein
MIKIIFFYGQSDMSHIIFNKEIINIFGKKIRFLKLVPSILVVCSRISLVVFLS